MVQQTVIISNKIGIHSRPAAMLVDTSSRFKSKITLVNGAVSASTQSMIRILALKAKLGCEIVVHAEGEDEAEALKAVVSLFEFKFGEE
jgi:phosphocarrier protein HPr